MMNIIVWIMIVHDKAEAHILDKRQTACQQKSWMVSGDAWGQSKTSSLQKPPLCELVVKRKQKATEMITFCPIEKGWKRSEETGWVEGGVVSESPLSLRKTPLSDPVLQKAESNRIGQQIGLPHKLSN